MIAELNGRITQQQIDDIANAIRRKYLQYLDYTNSPMFNSLFLQEYAPTKNTHSISWAISSAFPSGNVFSGLNVRHLDYGWFNNARPELYNNSAIFHILASTVKFDSKYLKEYYAMNHDFTKEIIYFYFYYTIVDNHITIEICLPDENGNVIKREVV